MSAAPPPAATRHDWRLALAVLGAAGVLRLVVAAILPLFPDETYYWEWARRLAPGYFDHPPLTAVLIRFGVALLEPLGLGATPLAVRLGPVLAGTAGTIAVAATARRVGGPRAALRAAVIAAVLPLAAAGLVLATPDAPLLGAVSLALYAVVRALQAPVRSRASLSWWAVSGVLLGLAFTSKYTAILFPVAVVLAVLLHPELRARLTEPGPYVACVVATLVFLPVLLWNASHDWLSFGFQLQHGLGRPRGSAMKRELDLLGGQAGLATPILFVMFVVVTWRALRSRRDSVRWMLAFVATFVLAFFAFSATRKHVEANWPAPAFIPAIALLAAASWSARGEKWLRAGVWLAGILSAIVYVHAVVPILPVPPRRDPVGRAFGWNDLAQVATVRQRETEARTGRRTWLGADRYQEASEIAFHGERQPTTFAVNLSGRRNQYDLWLRFPQVASAGDNLVLALDETDEIHSTVVRLQAYFTDVRRLDLVPLKRGDGVIGHRRLWVLEGWKTGWPR